MRTQGHVVPVALIILGLALAGIGGLAGAIQPEWWTAFTASLTVPAETPQGRWLLGAFGAVCLAASWLWIQGLIRRRFRERTIGFATSEGNVLIALSAIEDLVRQLTATLPELGELVPEIRVRDRRMTIRLRVTCWSDVQLPEATERLQNLVRTQVQQMLGVEDPVQVEVYVRKILHRDSATASAGATAAPVGDPFLNR